MMPLYGVEYTSPKTGERKVELYETAQEARTCASVYRSARERGGHDYQERLVTGGVS